MVVMAPKGPQAAGGVDGCKWVVAEALQGRVEGGHHLEALLHPKLMACGVSSGNVIFSRPAMNANSHLKGCQLVHHGFRAAHRHVN